MGCQNSSPSRATSRFAAGTAFWHSQGTRPARLSVAARRLSVRRGSGARLDNEIAASFVWLFQNLFHMRARCRKCNQSGKRKPRSCWVRESPLTDSNRRPPPYHQSSSATGRNPRQRFPLALASLGGGRFATDCHGLQPRGSIKAPFDRVVIDGYVSPTGPTGAGGGYEYNVLTFGMPLLCMPRRPAVSGPSRHRQQSPADHVIEVSRASTSRM